MKTAGVTSETLFSNRSATSDIAADYRHPRTIGWLGTTAMAMGGSNQMLFLVGSLVAAQGTAAIPVLIFGLLLSWAALPGWTELILMWPDRVGGIAASCSEAFRPYSRVLANLAGTCYWWGWVPTCGLTALLSASALHQWYLPAIPVTPLAVALVIIFTLANLAGLRKVTNLSVIIAAGSAVLAFLSAILPVLAGTVDWHQASSFHLKSPFTGMFGTFTSAMSGLYLVGFAAPAFEAAACHVGETINPKRNVPRAMYASAIMATLYFAVLPVVWLGVVGPKGMSGDLVSTLGPTFAPLFGSMAKAAAVWFMVLNMFHGTLTPITGVARTLSQLSEDGLLPRAFARRTRKDVPWVASAFTAGMAIAFLIGGDPVWVIAAANFTYLIGISLPSVAVFLLRRDEPNRERLYRAPRGTIGLGLGAAIVWGLTTVFGFEQFGLPTVIFGLVLAYSGVATYSWRQWRDRQGKPQRVKRSLHVKLTGAMLAVLGLDAVGYFLAVRSTHGLEPALTTFLQDIFVAVAMLTITFGLVLPGMIAHSATSVMEAADQLATGTLADLNRAMRALAQGDLEHARAMINSNPVAIHSNDELGAMAMSFNVIIAESGRVASSLDGAREALQSHRNELERLLHERTLFAGQQSAIAELGRIALASADERSLVVFAADVINKTIRCDRVGMVAYQCKTTDPVANHVLSIYDDNGYRRDVSFTADDFVAFTSLKNPTPLDYRMSQLIFTTPLPSGQPILPAEAHSMLAPIRTTRGAFGAFVAQRVDEFTASEIEFLTSASSIVGSTVERIQNESDLNYRAMHDQLTGLPSRALFRTRLDLALSELTNNQQKLAVLFIDIDQFKVVNDSLGHEKGDRLLEVVAERLHNAMRPGDTLARFGGDEFVVLAKDLRDSSHALDIAEGIQRLGDTPINLFGQEHFVRFSTGIANADSAGVLAVDLLRNADAAMYAAKKAGRGRTAVFDSAMGERAMRRFEVQAFLRRAISHGELVVHYQPIFSVNDGAVRSVEALVRLQHPTRGLVMPNDFIDIAEETGLIIALGQWVLDEACSFVQTLRSSVRSLADLTVSVNLSGRQLADADMLSVVANVLSTTGLPPNALILELTETVLMHDAQLTVKVLGELRDLGVKVSIDDFGTGYSSLGYLQRFPLDALKIDRSFVNRLGHSDQATAIVNATQVLAESLGLRTVAEGVETREQMEILRSLGCDLMQGYYFARPKPGHELIDNLANFEFARLRSTPDLSTSTGHS
jgi:diguanylate cyclase (GGDEF)-like protein